MKGLKVILVAIALWAAPPAVPVALAQVNGADTQMAGAAINAAGLRADKVKGITQVPSVGVVRLDFGAPFGLWTDQMGPADYRALARRNAAGVAKLQRALRTNPATRDALARHGISPSQVAGAQISSNGALRLYIFSR